MAEGQDSVKLIDDVCQCSICLERYVEPKVLICQHCFCKECLEDLIGVRVVDGNVLFPSKVAEIVCPNCREIHKLENGQTLTSLPGNLHLKQVLEVLNKSSPLQDATGSDYKFEDCSSCPEESRTEKGTRKCVDCSKFFCEKCVKKEHVGGSSDRSSHFIMKMDKSREGEITSCCMEHGNVLKYFCVGCQKLVCTDCVLISHRTHELQTVDCAAKMLHNNILKNISSVRSNGKNVEAVRAACLDAVHNQKITETMIASEVRLRKLKILAQVSYALDRAEEQIIDDFHNKGSEFVQKVNEKLEKVDSFLEHHKNVMELIDNFSDVSTLEFLCKVNALKRKAYENFLNTPSWWMQFITEGNVLRNGTAQGIPREGQWKMFLLILELMGCIHTSASTSVAQLRGFSPSLLKPLHPGDEYIKQMFHQMTLAGSEAKLVKTPEPELEGIASSSNNNKLGKSKTLPRPSLANGNEIEASAASAIISLGNILCYYGCMY